MYETLIIYVRKGFKNPVYYIISRGIGGALINSFVKFRVSKLEMMINKKLLLPYFFTCLLTSFTHFNKSIY